MRHKSVLLDTSFFIRFLKEDDPLFSNADNYFRFFLENNFTLFISTISIAEYCVGGDVEELPLKNLHILPFNFEHSKRAGEFARIVFENKGLLQKTDRNIIPNDTKLFSQADCEKSIEFYLTSDEKSQKIFELLKQETNPRFQFLSLYTPYNEAFGVLPLK